ncbi:type II toxin-antitoxin system VapC family toxin [Candidatus Woesearchaeota archaeon]|nr:type II toxin-antitoxin system VapC family toxin [Candidatus Woesearchaeota archaeon]
MICLDSNLIIDFLRNRQEAKAKLMEYNGENFATTIINVYELMSGIWSMGGNANKTQLEKLSAFVAGLTILQLDDKSIDLASRIYGELSLGGKIIDDLDILIAGMCISSNCSAFITNDVNHFSRIKGLNIEEY